MIKGITHRERISFKKTFLKNVQLIITYSISETKADSCDTVIRRLENDGFEVKSSDEDFSILAKMPKMIIAITLKGVAISVDKEDYVDFEHFKRTIEFVVSILAEMGLKECIGLVFQKQNSFKFNKDISKQYTKEQVFKQLFEKKIIDNIPLFGVSEDGYVHTVQPLYKEEDDYILAELLVSAMYLIPFELPQIIDLADKLNDNLYDLWYASVTDDVRKLMQ